MKKKPVYRAKWKPFSLNKKYWNEVLLGRTIKKVEYDKEGVHALVFDNGEKLFPIREVQGKKSGRFYIVADKD